MSECANESVAVCCNCRIALHQSAKQRAAQSAKCSRKISDLRENGTSKFAQNQQRELRAGSACLDVVHQVDLDGKLHAQLFFGAVKVKSRDFLNLLVSILDGVVVQVHCVRCHLQVPAVLNNVDE